MLTFFAKEYHAHHSCGVKRCDDSSQNGYDENFGARPLGRVIQDYIKKPLADELLFGKLMKGGVVHVSLKDHELTFDIRPEDPKKKHTKAKRKGSGTGDNDSRKNRELVD